MGCEVQVHEKTDKRGTWAFHSVDGWYLNTSPEHYRVHKCHIKQTRNERLSDTVHFKHKHITNPEITPQDKLMHAIAKCKEALLNNNTGHSDQQIQELLQIVKQAEAAVVPRVQKNQVDQVPRVQKNQVDQVLRVQEKTAEKMITNQPQQTVPRVQHNESHATGIQTRAMLQAQLMAARQAQATQQRMRRRRNNHLSSTINLPTQPPAHSTRSKTAAARLQAAPPAARTRSKVNCCVSRLRQPTRSSLGKTNKH